MSRIEIEYEEALRNRKLNDVSRWGYYKKTDFDDASGLFAGQRLRAEELFAPHIFGSVKLPRDGKYFAMGSCFAREIEKALVRKGIRFLSEPGVFDDEEPNPKSGSGSPGSTYVTKYHAFSILNAFRWAFEDPSPYPEAALIEATSGQFVDLHSHTTLKYLPKEYALERRRKVDDYVARATEADVIILTLGLCELWWDKEVETYLNVAPDGRMARAHPGRFVFRLPDIEELHAALDELHGLIMKHAKHEVQIVCTVSPVALGDTFRMEDVVVANCFSKALNRVAVEYWRNKYENVHYFPSYEMVTCSELGAAWQEDRRHPSKEMVAKIMETFERDFLE